MHPIVTLTMNPALDVSTDVGEVEPNAKLRCGPARLDPGGGGVNVARAIRSLGGRATAIYPCGGYTGEAFRELLAEEDVDERPVPIAGRIREDFTATETATGDQYRYVLQGPELSEAEWRRCLDETAGTLVEGAYVVASGSLPPGVPADFYARLARLARERGARCIVDASGEPTKAALAEGIFAFKPNQREMEELTGEKLSDRSRQAEAAREIVDRGGAELVALTLAAGGALFAWNGGIVRVPAPRIDRKSAVGAGDSFLAGLVLRLAEDRSWREAFRTAAAAGGSALSTPGTELCRHDQTEALERDLELEEQA